jgi:peptide-methionine (S)-S-oxide reductase
MERRDFPIPAPDAGTGQPRPGSRAVMPFRELPAILVLLVVGMLVPATGLADERNRATALFAGGCFWCMEEAFDKVDGVVETTSGYIGGTVPNPTYEQVSSGRTGHTQVVRITYDPNVVSYPELLDVFWRNHDPLTPNRQFCDHGSQYRAAIFYHDEEQKKVAEETKRMIEASGRFEQPIVTEIVPADAFYEAEEYHQGYYVKNPLQYTFYRWNCGRDQRLKELWGTDSEQERLDND